MILGEVSASQTMKHLSFHAGEFGLSPMGRGKREMLLQEMRTMRKGARKLPGREGSNENELALQTPQRRPLRTSGASGQHALQLSTPAETGQGRSHQSSVQGCPWKAAIPWYFWPAQMAAEQALGAR